MRKSSFLICLAITSLITTPTFGQEKKPTPAKVVGKVVDAANSLLKELTPAQRKKILFSFDDQKQRRRWSNLPSGIYKRLGLRMGDLNKKQKAAVMNLIKATMSKRGYQQVVDNINGDEILKKRGQRGRVVFGKDEYYVSILGTPSTTKPWMWQFGGHHLAINATIVGDKITLAPSLTGGQPVTYMWGKRKVRQLAGEQDKSFALVNSLSKKQLKEAVLGDHHVNLAFGPTAKNIKPKKQGINAKNLTKKQQKTLIGLIRERIGILNDTHSEMMMKKIIKELPKTYFAWYGPTKKGSAATFRIQGPSVIIEYSPQHLGGDATEHTHAMYRDPTNDYGTRFLKGKN